MLDRHVVFCSISSYFVPHTAAAHIDPSELNLLVRIGISLEDLVSNDHSQRESQDFSSCSQDYDRLVERLKLDNVYSAICESDEAISEPLNLQLELNLKQFLIDHSLRERKGCYHGNLNFVRGSSIFVAIQLWINFIVFLNIFLVCSPSTIFESRVLVDYCISSL